MEFCFHLSGVNLHNCTDAPESSPGHNLPESLSLMSTAFQTDNKPGAAIAANPKPHSTATTSARRARWTGILLVIVAAIVYGLTLDTGLASGELRGGDLITHHYA